MLLFPFGEIVSEIFYWLVMALDNLVFRASLNRIQGMTRRAKSERVLFSSFLYICMHMYVLIVGIISTIDILTHLSPFKFAGSFCTETILL